MRRRYWIIVMIGTGLILIGSLIYYLLSPYWAFRQIVSAMERKDIDTLYNFVLDGEKEMITKEIVFRVLEDILYKNAKIVKACRTPLEKIQGKLSSDSYRFYCGWMDGVTGKPLPSFRKATGGVMTLQIDLYRSSGWGWKMHFTKMALSYFALNFPQDKMSQAFRLYFKKWGIPAIYEPSYIIIRGRVKYLWDKPRWRKLPP